MQMISPQALRGLRSTAIAAATGASLMLAAAPSFAAIVWSGPVNLAIPATLNGLYVNVITGANNLPLSTAGTTVPGWDINPYGSTGLSFFSATPNASSGYTGVLAFGAPIGASFTTTIVTPAVGAWTYNSTSNYVGFRFLNEGANLVSPADDTVHYGWMQIGLGATTLDRRLVSYAFESSPMTTIAAGVVPEPGTYALMGLGLAGLMVAARRRKQH